MQSKASMLIILDYFSLQNLVERECENWAGKGMNIKYATRSSRKGFKAGALKKGMEYDYAKQCEYVAIFDADFQPEQDFLLRTVPFFIHNPEVALVQARWAFGMYKISYDLWSITLSSYIARQCSLAHEMKTKLLKNCLTCLHNCTCQAHHQFTT